MRSRRSARPGSRKRGSVAEASQPKAKSVSKGKGAQQAKLAQVQRLIDKVAERVVTLLGLDILGMSKEEAMEALGDALYEILTATKSLPSLDAAMRKVERVKEGLVKLAISYYLEKGKELDEEKLEFIVTQGQEVLVPHIQLLHREVRRRGLDHLIGYLMSSWELYGKPTPLRCPHCGFRAVTPGLECFVCGSPIREDELKEANDFREKLIEYAEVADPFELEKIVRSATVLWGETIKPPDAPATPYDVEISITERERELLKKYIRAKLQGKRLFGLPANSDRVGH